MEEYEIKMSSRFERWNKNLTPQKKVAVQDRVLDIAIGDFGDHHQIEKNLWELRFMSGNAAGLRIYYTIQKGKIIFLAAGGNKSSQKKDIEAAKKILKTL